MAPPSGTQRPAVDSGRAAMMSSKPLGGDLFAAGNHRDVMGEVMGMGPSKVRKNVSSGIFWASWACLFSIETEACKTIHLLGEGDTSDPFPRDSKGGRIWANCGTDAFELHIEQNWYVETRWTCISLHDQEWKQVPKKGHSATELKNQAQSLPVEAEPATSLVG